MSPKVVLSLSEGEQMKDPSQGNWEPACGGTEMPFISRSGRRLLYCYQASTGSHGYLDCDTDIILSDEEARAYLQTW